MVKLTLTAVGEPKTIKTKFGDKQKSYVKAQEFPDKFLNYWLGEQTKNWKVGDVVEVESVDARDYTATDGSLKTSYDIKLPKAGFGEITKKIETLENAITSLKLRVSNLEAKLAPQPPEYPEYEGPTAFDVGEAIDDEIPFN